MDFYSFITLLAALIAIGASVISPMLTAKYTQQGAYKLKSTELFFDRQADAYKNFLLAVNTLPPNPSSPEIARLNSALIQANLFSSIHTQKILTAYTSQIITLARYGKRDEDLGELIQQAILAMQSELKEYKPQ